MNLRPSVKLGILCAVVVTGVASAQESKQPPETTAPQITTPERSFNFGYAPQKAKISHLYWIYNTGGDTLRIADIKPP